MGGGGWHNIQHSFAFKIKTTLWGAQTSPHCHSLLPNNKPLSLSWPGKPEELCKATNVHGKNVKEVQTCLAHAFKPLKIKAEMLLDEMFLHPSIILSLACLISHFILKKCPLDRTACKWTQRDHSIFWEEGGGGAQAVIQLSVLFVSASGFSFVNSQLLVNWFLALLLHCWYLNSASRHLTHKWQQETQMLIRQ